MTLLTEHVAQREPAAETAALPAFWGLDHKSLHDRFWASRGVQIVRPGMLPEDQPVPPSIRGMHRRVGRRHRADFYLLLGEDDLVLFRLAPLLDRFGWLKPGAMRLRLVEQEPQPYVEVVETDEHDRLKRISRRYHGRSRATLQAWLTADAKAAWAWAQSRDTVAARKRIKSILRHGAVIPATAAARLFKASASPAQVDQFLLVLQRMWHRPGATLDGVYEFSRDVWVHESARVAPSARLIAPLWIGAGAEIGAASVVVGPGGVADQTGSEVATRPIDWEYIRFASRSRFAHGEAAALSRPGKRLFDIAFAAAALLGTAILYPIVIAAILLEDGWPAFFIHRRQTIGGREFPCYKFRTMCRNAEAMKAQVAGANICDGPQFHIDDDPRVLKVGRVLRKYHLDELPQFWNVLLGHMSVVGPRPSPDKENQFCPTWREARLSVRPGVTGLWQVRRTRRPENDFQEWIRYDLEYIQNQNWRLDLWIIAQTIRKMLV